MNFPSHQHFPSFLEWSLSHCGVKVFLFEYANHFRLYSKSDMQVMNCSSPLAYLLRRIMSESFREQEHDPVCCVNARI